MRGAERVAGLAGGLAGRPGVLTLVEWARLTGGLHHVELALFARLGRLSVASPDAALASWAMGAAGAAAWRAAQLEALLPVSVGLPALAEVVRPPAGEVAEALARLESVPAGELAEEVSGVWYPALGGAYELRLSGCSVAGDRPFATVLTRLLADLREAEQQVVRLVASTRAPARAASGGA